MPEGEFAALASLPDAYLASCFCLPPEQIPARRCELGVAADPDGADRDPDRFQRAAARWHGRLCLEARGMRAADAELALEAIRGLGDGLAAPAAEALAGILSAHCLEREAALVEEWLDGRQPD